MNICKKCNKSFSNRSNNFKRHIEVCNGLGNDTNHIIGKCKHCQVIFDISDKPKGWMANHSRWCDNNPKRQSYNTDNYDKIILMKKSSKESGYTNQFTKAKILGLEIPPSNLLGKKGKSTPHTQETKNIISQKRKEFLKNNPDKHPWKSTKGKSKPCENFKEFLKNKGIKFSEEITPLEDRMFSIDIAFVDKQIAIEVNGNQHYENDRITLKPYYQERHDFIESAGWIIFECHYSNFFDDESMEQILNLFIDKI